jgi:RND superfamily putative drug exporter
MIDKLAGVVCGRRTKWVVIAVWVAVLAALLPSAMSLPDVTADETATADSLPADSQAAKVTRTIRERFPGGEQLLALAVYRRAGGLTDPDKARVLADAKRIADVKGVGDPIAPFGPLPAAELVSKNGKVAFTAIPLTSHNSDERTDAIEEIRVITKGGDGREVRVTGPAALQSDLTTTLQSTDASLLLATAGLVLVLLIAIYRSPLVAILPLIVVGIAYTIAEGIVHLGANAFDTTIDRTAVTLLAILMFGAGTDYCLLLVSRYTSELREVEDHHEALRRAYVRAAPAIAASGVVVAGALLTLLAARLHSNRIFGPVNAAGVLVGLLASLTLLPAMLAVAGRRGFWPSRKLVALRAPREAPRLLSGLQPLPDFSAMMKDAHPNIRQRDGVWRRVGEAALKRPALTLAASLVVLLVCAAGVTTYTEDVNVVGQFRKDTDSTKGFDLLSSGFPKGTLYPNTVLIDRGDGPLTPPDIARVQDELKATPGVALVSQIPTRTSTDKRAVTLAMTFADDPFGQPALDRVGKIRTRLAALKGSGITAQIGDGSALRVDYKEAASGDQTRVIPLVLLVIGITLVVLLRALVAPLYLLVTVLISYFATLGISLVVFDVVFDEPTVDPAFPFLAFVFLVALGVDYNIFLMDRVREESRRHGTREGALRALVATGPVITSAGLILAGTFAVLTMLPLDILLELGFTVALGVLLDTFVVRTLVVPALIKLVGDASWWPAKLKPPDDEAPSPRAPAQPPVSQAAGAPGLAPLPNALRNRP